MVQNTNQDKNDQRKSYMTVQEAGRKGGTTTREKYGRSFYSEIGRDGGKKSHGGGRKKKSD